MSNAFAERFLAVLHAAYGTNELPENTADVHKLAQRLGTAVNEAIGHTAPLEDWLTPVVIAQIAEEFIAQRTETEPEPELDDSQVEIPDTYCPACNAFDHDRLGQLGNLFWFRCTCCGIDYSKEVVQ